MTINQSTECLMTTATSHPPTAPLSSALECAAAGVRHPRSGAFGSRGARILPPPGALALREFFGGVVVSSGEVAPAFLQRLRVLPHLGRSWATRSATRAASLQLLDQWEAELNACYDGHPRHPVFVALAETVRKFEIPKHEFADLLTAFRQDQSISRYETFNDLLGYCRYSANPVGHLVLYLCGYRDSERQLLSDYTCTALQLANFWQDVSCGLCQRTNLSSPRRPAPLRRERRSNSRRRKHFRVLRDDEI